MKKFWRTYAGKTILFLGCLLGFLGCVGSAAGIAIFWETDVYTTPEKTFRDQVLQDEMKSELYEIWEQPEIAAPLAAFAESDGQQMPDFPLIADCRNSNLVFEVTDPATGELLACSGEAAADGSLQKSSAPEDGWSLTTKVAVHIRKGQPPELSLDYVDQGTEAWSTVLLKAGLREGFPVSDSDGFRYGLVSRLVHAAYLLRYVIYVIALAALLLMIACFVALMSVSGRRPDTEELVPGPFYRWPADLLLFLAMICLVPSIAIIDSGVWWLGVVWFMLAGLALGLGFAMSAAVRIKGRTLLSNTITWRLLKITADIIRKVWKMFLHLMGGCRRGLAALPMIPRTVLIVGGISFVELIFMLANISEGDNILLLWFFERLILIPLIFIAALSLRKLQRAGRELAAGNLSWHTDTKGMRWALKEHAENLNHIAEGMGLAVEERLKSERMKTELITNVSHDIKTPLTSIINYARLIGEAAGEDETLTEYSQVLVRQSERLKRLLEDLVEASKASTGNLEVCLSPCDPAIFVTQAGGEYEEKLEKAGLTLVSNVPEQEMRIMADPRRMWRIFDNLMNNICKYAQSGTRVYLTLADRDGQAEIIFRNTSREALNISEEELMERFVRGDASRNTEGNGLGLSIAKSLAELQGGNLRIAIDGDLFKAILTFPVLK